MNNEDLKIFKEIIITYYKYLVFSSGQLSVSKSEYTINKLINSYYSKEKFKPLKYYSVISFLLNIGSIELMCNYDNDKVVYVVLCNKAIIHYENMMLRINDDIESPYLLENIRDNKEFDIIKREKYIKLFRTIPNIKTYFINKEVSLEHKTKLIEKWDNPEEYVKNWKNVSDNNSNGIYRQKKYSSIYYYCLNNKLYELYNFKNINDIPDDLIWAKYFYLKSQNKRLFESVKNDNNKYIIKTYKRLPMPIIISRLIILSNPNNLDNILQGEYIMDKDTYNEVSRIFNGE